MLLLIALSAWSLFTPRAGSRYCVQLGASSNYQYSGGATVAAHDVPELKRDGVTSVREDLLWSVVQPTGPTRWNWQGYDRLFTTMARLGVRVLPIVDYGTTWASGSNILAMPASTVGQLAYARYAAAVTQRYGPDGTFWRDHPTLPALPIAAVELWNEPWFQANASVDTYVALVRLAGAAVHRVSPSTLVAANVDHRHVHGSSATSPLWGASVLAHSAELAGVVDRWAIHPYPSTGAANPAQDAIDQIRWLQGQLAARDARGQIWVTELGFSTATASGQAPSASFRMFMRAAAGVGGSHRVSAVWAFTVARPSASTRPGSFDYGYNLVSREGQVLPPLAAADAARCLLT